MTLFCWKGFNAYLMSIREGGLNETYIPTWTPWTLCSDTSFEPLRQSSSLAVFMSLGSKNRILGTPGTETMFSLLTGLPQNVDGAGELSVGKSWLPQRHPRNQGNRFGNTTEPVGRLSSKAHR